MKLGHKNLAYSLALVGILMLFLVGYFIYMLPSLYVEHIVELNLKSIREQHRSYMEKHSYEDAQVRNPTACFSVEIPAEGDRILVAGKIFSAEILIRDERLGKILKRCREKMNSFADAQGGGGGEEIPEEKEIDLEQEIEELGEIFRENLEDNSTLPVELNLINVQNMEELYFGEMMKYHYYSGNMFIVETGVSDNNNHYTNYIAMEEKDGSLVMSFLPVVTPQMEEIRPVVLQSLPMLGAVMLLLVLLFSQVYSGGIVNPVVELVRRTEEMKAAGEFGGGKGDRRGQEKKKRARKDEIGQLADTLEDFYLQIRKSYRELEEENRRQDIFLRASSHQLKTPVAAALLLVEGMINEVGRYKDRDRYLPKVKEQLLSMRKIVEDILYLNRCVDNMQPGQVDLGRLAGERLSAYQVVLAEKGIRTEFQENTGAIVYADEGMLVQIVDNLLSNAVKYTPEGGRIRILLWQEERQEESGSQTGSCIIRIENFGVTIPEDILPHVLEPFVSGCHGVETKGMFSHGLGLYIASYYAGKLGGELSVTNGENSVTAELRFHPIFI